ncbi:MAG: carbamoyl phosphate synthase, partial [Clostridia bacterium]|nr:carbamoyl phosphate synthase [Clostridia bacterium]
MDDLTNILILSCGTRNKIVQYFKNELGNKGQVIATDCSN